GAVAGGWAGFSFLGEAGRRSPASVSSGPGREAAPSNSASCSGPAIALRIQHPHFAFYPGLDFAVDFGSLASLSRDGGPDGYGDQARFLQKGATRPAFPSIQGDGNDGNLC